jgi:hypothetical protein
MDGMAAYSQRLGNEPERPSSRRWGRQEPDRHARTEDTMGQAGSGLQDQEKQVFR